jgi:maltose-binding protein MalE
MRRFMHGADDEHALQNDEFAANITPTQVASWQYDGSLNPFLDGNAVMHRNWGGFLPSTVEEHGTDKLGYMVLPYAQNAGSQYENTGVAGNSALGGWSYAVNKNTEEFEAVREVIRAAITDEFYATGFNQEGNVPPKPSVLKSDAVRDSQFGPYVDTFVESANHIIPRPASAVWLEEWSPISENVNAAYRQEKSPEQAMADCAESLEAIEQQYA